MSISRKSFLFILIILINSLSAGNIELPFDANTVMTQVNHCWCYPPSRDGEFLIDTNCHYTPAPGRQMYPSAAFDGTNYLVVWSDCRSGYYDYDIYGARVSQSGTVLDPTGIAISTASGEQFEPSVAFDGTNYLVVWGDVRGGYHMDIYGTRVSQAGTVLDPEGVAISTAAADQGCPSLAFDGANYMVVWQDNRSGYFDIYGARVNQAGTVLDPEGIAISVALGENFQPSVAFDGTNHFIVWQDNRSGYFDIYGARVNQAGTVLDPEGIAISTAAGGQWSSSVAFDGINYMVVWHDYRTGMADIYGARVSQTGAVLDSNGIAISTLFEEQISPSLIFDGTNYLVVWYDYRGGASADIYGARVSQAGTVLDPSGIAISTATHTQWCPSVAYDGTNALVVWGDIRSDGNYDNSDIYGARVSQAGTILDTIGIAVSTVVYSQWFPAIVSNGTEYMVVWTDYRTGVADIYGARVTQAGVVLDPDGIAISTATSHQSEPSISFDGSNYLVVWRDSRGDYYDIYGARVSQTGTVLDPDGIGISTLTCHQSEPSVSFDGTNHLVVWRDSRGDGFDIYGARVSQTGTVLDSDGIAISPVPYSQRHPAVAFDGSNYLVVWQEYHSISSHDIYGARVNPAGVVLDPGGIAISTTSEEQSRPSIAFDGTNYLVVWTDCRSSHYDIYGTRITQAGVVLDPAGLAISTALEEQSCPSITFNGTNYLAVWQDLRSGYYDIYGARVNQAGILLDEFEVSLQPGIQIDPTSAHGQGTQMLITYSGFIDSIGSHLANTMRIWGKFYPFIGLEERDIVHPLGLILQSTPNPFHQYVDIRCEICDNSEADLKIYDITGRLVRNLSEQSRITGQTLSITWDGTGQDNRPLPTGIYFLKLTVKGNTETRKLLLIR